MVQIKGKLLYLLVKSSQHTQKASVCEINVVVKYVFSMYIFK